MPDKSKFEREIDEILEKTETDPKPWSSKRSNSKSSKRRSYEPFSPSVPKGKAPKRSRTGGIKLDSGYLIIGGLIVLAVAAFSGFAQVPLAIAGFALLVIGYVFGIRSGSRSGFSGSGFGRGKTVELPKKAEPEAKYWRGRRIDEKPAEPDQRSDRGRIIDFGTPPDDDDDSSSK
jgi:hypothetical protein